MNQMSVVSEQQRHYADVRTRLRGRPVLDTAPARPKPTKATPIVAAPLPVEPIAPATPCCPINMLAPPSWRFLVAYSALKAGITAEDILGRSRAGKIAAARHDAVALIYSHQPRTLTDLGRLFGRNHSSIFNSLQMRAAKPFKREVPLIRPVVKPGLTDDAPPREATSLTGRSIEELEEENRQLRNLLGAEPQFEFVVACREKLDLQPAYAKFLSILVQGRIRTHEGLWTAYSATMHNPPALGIIKVLVVGLRKALRPHGINIKTVWGEGFLMSAEDRAKVRQILGMEAGL
jgi:hypothetical protein